MTIVLLSLGFIAGVASTLGVLWLICQIPEDEPGAPTFGGGEL